MNISEVAKLSPTERFLYWVKERESIRLKRGAGEDKPWTDDEILQSYRFCNVRRMDDKVSQWLLKNWYEPNYGRPDMLVHCALARLINLPETLAEIGFQRKWRGEHIKRVCRDRSEAGELVYNNAYIIRGGGNPDKIGAVVDWYLTPLRETPVEVDSSSIQVTWSRLVSRFGFGSFMAGQVVADLRWSMEGSWEDRNTWAAIGPGSKRGMNRIHERPFKQALSQTQFNEELLELIEVLADPRLEAIDVQNCCCEFDKYERTLFEGRRPKAKYPGK